MKNEVLLAIEGASSRRPVPSCRLAKNGETLRHIVNELRSEGNVICANRKGYWIAENRQQGLEWLESLKSRINSMNRAKRGVVKGLEKYKQ